MLIQSRRDGIVVKNFIRRINRNPEGGYYETANNAAPSGLLLLFNRSILKKCRPFGAFVTFLPFDHFYFLNKPHETGGFEFQCPWSHPW